MTQISRNHTLENFDLGIFGPNFKITDEGGYAFRMINKTGTNSVKGQPVEISSSTDDGYIAATDSLNVQGFVYEAGIADGQYVWVVRDGIADMLLADGYGAIRNGWIRLSSTTAGRVAVQSTVGYEQRPTSIAYTQGAVVSGTLADLLLDNGTKYVMSEASATPGLSAVFTFALTEAMNALNISGYTTSDHNSGIVFAVYNYSTPGWDDKITFPKSGSADVVYTDNTLTADNYNAGEMLVRALHSEEGNTGHRIYLDKLTLQSTADHEHFRELGHALRAATAGTNVLVRANIHFL
jgi:hypothetical protein